MGAAVSRHHRSAAAVRTRIDPELGLIAADAVSRHVTPLDVQVNLPEPSAVSSPSMCVNVLFCTSWSLCIIKSMQAC
jgi:hypothetical protein